MTSRGAEFLDNWIREHVTAAQNNGDTPRAFAMAIRCIFDAHGKGISREELEAVAGSVEDVIRDAIERMAEPGTPGD